MVSGPEKPLYERATRLKEYKYSRLPTSKFVTTLRKPIPKIQSYFIFILIISREKG